MVDGAASTPDFDLLLYGLLFSQLGLAWVRLKLRHLSKDVWVLGQRADGSVVASAFLREGGVVPHLVALEVH